MSYFFKYELRDQHKNLSFQVKIVFWVITNYDIYNYYDKNLRQLNLIHFYLLNISILMLITFTNYLFVLFGEQQNKTKINSNNCVFKLDGILMLF